MKEEDKAWFDRAHKMYPDENTDENSKANYRHITLRFADASLMSEPEAEKLHDAYHKEKKIIVVSDE